MKRVIAAFIIIVVSCCINIAYAAGPDDFVIIQTKAFLDDYGIHDKGYGYKAILTKAFAESAEGKALVEIFSQSSKSLLEGNLTHGNDRQHPSTNTHLLTKHPRNFL